MQSDSQNIYRLLRYEVNLARSAQKGMRAKNGADALVWCSTYGQISKICWMLRSAQKSGTSRGKHTCWALNKE